jgi:hypothetical protein
MLERHFPERHSRAAITDYLLSVDVEGSTANPPPFQFRSPHSSLDALDDEMPTLCSQAARWRAMVRGNRIALNSAPTGTISETTYIQTSRATPTPKTP